MRRTLKLLLLLGIGLLMAKVRSPDGPDGDGDDLDPITGKPINSEERDERLRDGARNGSPLRDCIRPGRAGQRARQNFSFIGDGFHTRKDQLKRVRRRVSGFLEALSRLWSAYLR
jgi:hypothetical protein